MYSCHVKWSTDRNVRSKQENTFGACGQEKAMLPVSSIGGERGVAHRCELRSIDPTSSAVRQLGDTLYNLRITAGLTQQQLAALTGGRWSRSHIGRVENGDVTPSPGFVEAMDGLLGGDRSLVQCLPRLLLETARQRSQRQWQRREPSTAPPSPNQETEELDQSALYTRPGTAAHDPAPAASHPAVSVPGPSVASPSAPPPSGLPSSGPSPSGPPQSGAPPSGPSLPGPRPFSPPGPDPRALGFEQGEPARIEPEPKDQELRSTANRSQFLRMTLWTGLGAVMGSVRLTLRVEGPAGGPVTHEQLELAVEQYARAYWATPAGVLFGQVRQCRQLVDGMLDQRQPASRRRHLHLVAGWLSALLGNLSFHLGDYRPAREGQALAPNPLVRAQLASWGEARALARMGDRRGVLEAIARGSRAIESSGDDWSPGGVFSFSVGEFEQYCGTACLWLDLPEEAKRHADHAFELRDTVAAKALARLDVAAAESQLGRPAEASQIGAEVLQMPAEYLIDPIVRRATELAASLEPHRSLAEVRDFNERLASLISSPGEPRAASSASER